MLVVFFALIGFFTIRYSMNSFFQPQQLQELKATTIFQPKGALPAFSLLKTNGEKFTEQSLRGRWTAIFFGYRTCPSICPATLAMMNDIWSGFGSTAPFDFVFASIVQDDPKTLENFLTNFNPKFTGVVGTKDEMQNFSNNLGIYAVPSETLEGEIDHTASVMLINPRGQLFAAITPPFDLEAIKADLEKILEY